MNPNGEPDANPENDAHCVYVDVVSDVEDVLADGGLNIYPNPASERIFIDLSVGAGTTTDYEVMLFGTDGRRALVEQCDQGVNEITLNALNPGVYLVCITAQSEIIACKRVVVI
jgi:hypothetical protein